MKLKQNIIRCRYCNKILPGLINPNHTCKEGIRKPKWLSGSNRVSKEQRARMECFKNSLGKKIKKIDYRSIAQRNKHRTIIKLSKLKPLDTKTDIPLISPETYQE